jgi:YHS domain-containing protein
VHPIKLIIIAILLYLGYRLLTSNRRKRLNKNTNNSASDTKADGVIEDVLVEDPICHKLVPKQQAVRLKLKDTDTIVYFCSEKCCNLFVTQEGEKK